MEKMHLENIEKLNYASLDETKEKRLRELEKKFNSEFGTDYYFMVMNNK